MSETKDYVRKTLSILDDIDPGEAGELMRSDERVRDLLGALDAQMAVSVVVLREDFYSVLLTMASVLYVLGYRRAKREAEMPQFIVAED